MKEHRLLLFAGPGELEITSHKELIPVAEQIGLIGDALPDHGTEEKQAFQAGERFVDLITFLGCSPDIALSPQEDKGQGFCHARFPPITDEPQWFTARNTQPPHCKRCKQARKDWQALRDGEYECADCNPAEWPGQWVWRKTGAISRAVIEIMHVYPHEAVPSPALLQAFAEASGVNWAYAYLQADL